jgi:hypothetical protein
MRQIRYQLWSVDPLNPKDERPIFGTFTIQACRRIIEVYNTRDECHRVLIARPVECEIPADHVYSCQVHARSGRVFSRRILALDAYAAARDCLRRFGAGIDEVAVWLYDDRAAGAPPILRVDRVGKTWKTTRIAS